jgi:DNA uptake protein ComE-like DNA-binding protein
MAPKSGRETRSDIQELARNSYEGGRDRLQELLEQVSRRMQPAVDKAREGMDTARDRIESVADRIRDEASGIRNQGKDKVRGSDLMSILNDWPHERLIEIDGIGPVLATRIMQNRPYESEQQLVESKQLPPSAIESLRNAA